MPSTAALRSAKPFWLMGLSFATSRFARTFSATVGSHSSRRGSTAAAKAQPSAQALGQTPSVQEPLGLFGSLL